MRALRRAHLIVDGTTHPKDAEGRALDVGAMAERVVEWLLAERLKSRALERRLRRVDAGLGVIMEEMGRPVLPGNVDEETWQCTACGATMDERGDPSVFADAHAGCVQ